MLQEQLPGDAERAGVIVEHLKDILQYDPELSTYTPDQADRIKKWRERKVAETGQTLYVIEGGKEAYQRKRHSNARVQPAHGQN